MVKRSSPARLIVSLTGTASKAAPCSRAAEKTALTMLFGQAGPGRVVDGHELADRPHPLECPGDRVGPLRAAVDHVEVQEGGLVVITPIEQLPILGRDRHDDLLDFSMSEERVQGAEPDGPALELGVDLLLLGIAEPRGSSGGGENHGELSHGLDSSNPGNAR